MTALASGVPPRADRPRVATIGTQIRLVFVVAYAVVVAFFGVLWVSLEHLVTDTMWSNLESVATLAAYTWERDPTPPTVPMAPRISLRLTVMASDGRVLEDSYREASVLPNQGQQPEVARALLGETARAQRFAPVLGAEMMFVAVPLHDTHGRIVGAMRASTPSSVVNDRIWESRRDLLLGFVLCTIMASVLAEGLIRATSRPLERLSAAVRSGDETSTLPEEGSQEVIELSRSVSEMRSEIGRQYTALQAQHARVERLLERLKDGILVMDSQGRIVFSTRAASALLGSDASWVTERIQDATRSGTEQSFQVTLPESRRDLLVETLGVPWGTEAGAHLAVIRDVTDFVRLDRMRADFVANASHELRTPITAVSTALEALEMGAIDDAEAREDFMARARRAIDRLARLANALLDLSAAEGDLARDAAWKCDAAQVTSSVVTMLAETAAARGQQLHLAPLPSPAPVAMHEVDLQRAIGNVISNAINHTARGSHIDIELRIAEGQAHIRVADDGEGITAAHVDQIFDRFFRSDASRSSGGCGLGLTITRRLLQRCGGTITASNRPEGGAVFEITLPLEGAHENALSNPSISQVEGAADHPNG